MLTISHSKWMITLSTFGISFGRQPGEVKRRRMKDEGVHCTFYLLKFRQCYSLYQLLTAVKYDVMMQMMNQKYTIVIDFISKSDNYQMIKSRKKNY